MRVICAPDKFKESLTAEEAAAALVRGVQRACPAAWVDPCPIADGGEGTVNALVAATGGRLMSSRVTGPLGTPVDAAWGLLGRQGGDDHRGTAVIEMAAAAGLALVPPDRRDPTRTTTCGVGELIIAAMDEGCRRIILGIGGSATTDGGCGAARAVGWRFYDAGDQLLGPMITGADLARIARFDDHMVDRRLAEITLEVACDVTNPLTGPSGAAAIYGPQKGATPEQVRLLDQALAHLAALVRAHLGRDVDAMAGSGAAGGLGGGLVAFLHATLSRGIDLVLSAVNFDQRVRDCTLCLTGEGRLDGQSLSGKACLGVAQAAARAGVPTIALVGSTGPEVERTLMAGLRQYHLIGEGLAMEQSMRRAGELLERAAERVTRQWMAAAPDGSAKRGVRA